MQQDQLDPDCQDTAKDLLRDASSEDERRLNEQKLIEQDMLSRRRALVYVIAQSILTLCLPLLLLIVDVVTAYSALAGGMIATISNAWFTYRVFRVDARSAARTMLASVYVGEVNKIVLTSALFVCVFVVIEPLDALALFLTYFLIHITPLLVNVFGRYTGDIEYKRENNG